MIKQKALVLAVAAVLAMPLAACGNSGTSTTTDTKSEATTTQSSSSSSDSKTKDASYYAGQWRGSVETTGQTVYGTAGGTEQMLDVFLNEDGTAETKPCKNHEDLLTATGKVKKEDFDAVARTALNDGAIIVNPAQADYEDILAILEEVWA